MENCFDDVENDELLSGDDAISKIGNEGLPTVVNNGLDEDPDDPTTSAKVIVHFRRHPKWEEYMEATIDGTTPATKDDLLYGFDWLGDEHYDFGKTNVLTEREGRYNYIFNNVTNSISDPNINTKIKTTKLIHDRSFNSAENFVTAKSNLKNVYTQGAKLTTVHTKEYLPAWISLAYNRKVKIQLGLRNENLTTGASAGPQFGDSNDVIHLIPETGYEASFTIAPNEIRKADLESGSVEITLKCITPISTPISIMAYHVDDLTTKEADKPINVAANGKKVGELKVMENDKNHLLNIVIVKVKKYKSDFKRSNFGAFGSQEEIEKTLIRGLGQASLNCSFSAVETIDKNDSGRKLTLSTDIDGGESGYNTYINNQFLYKEYKDQIIAENTANTPVTYANFVGNVRKPFAEKKRFLLFLHDYKHKKEESETKGAADVVEIIPDASTGKWASIFKSANKSTLIHETAHTLGLCHTFNLYPLKEATIYYYPFKTEKDRKGDDKEVSTREEVFILSKSTSDEPLKPVYFKKREVNGKHLFVRGTTENIMDYEQKFRWDESQVTYARRAKPPRMILEADKDDCFVRPYIYRAGSSHNFFKNEDHDDNKEKNISFWQWQWSLLLFDKEVITTNVIVVNN